MGSAVDPIGVAVVDAEPGDRERLASALDLAADLDVVGAVADAREAVALLERVEPDVVVADVRIVTELERPPAVLAVAREDARPLAVDALRAGAAGFCSKESTPAELAGAVRGVAVGHAVVERAVLDALLERVPIDETALPDLTQREREVMALVAQGATNPEVSQALVITDATVRTHVRSLRRKLGARTRAELVSRVYELGRPVTWASPAAGPTPALPLPSPRASPSVP